MKTKAILISIFCIVSLSFGWSTVTVQPANAFLYTKQSAAWNDCSTTAEGMVVKVNGVEYYIKETDSGYKGISAMLLSCFMNGKDFMITYYPSNNNIVLVRISG